MNQHIPELTLIGPGKLDVGIQTPAENADETGAIPQNAALSSTENCPQCGNQFQPRKGGRPQRFCSEPCRMAFHSEAREADKTTLASLRERGTLPIPPAATMTPELPPVATGDFDWAADESVVLREQPETAVYFNAEGALVIRQRAAWNQEDDPFVFISPANIGEFLDKLTDICGVPSVGRA